MISKQYKKVVQLGSVSIIHSNWLPYAAGCLISYCNSIDEIKQQYHFADPLYKHLPVINYTEELKQADILGLTCYVWNQNYNDELSKYYKQLRPDGIVVYGGPQIPEDDAAKQRYDDERDWVDYTVAGLGEIAFAEFLLNKPRSHATLDKMPSPYIDGIFDNILAKDETFKVSFESNRGCPYGCSFCDWGGQSKSKLTRFDLEDIFKTIEYIYKHDNINELEILDANFGILSRDVDIINHMIEQQTLTGNHLRISYSGLAKNGSKHLPKILGKIFEQIPIDQRNLKISFQTHTPEVLKVINRSNIDNNRLLPLINEYKKQNIPTTSEMIIALPGETADSWLQTLHYNHHTIGIDHVRTYILHIVENTDMNKPEYRNKYGIQTKTVLIGNQAFDIINKCYSYDLPELIKMFDYHWFYHNLINTNLLRPYIEDVYNDCKRFYDELDNMPVLKSIIEDQRSLISDIFGDGTTVITNPLHQRFFSSSMRTDDLRRMIDNSVQVEYELSQFIKIPLDTNWMCKDPLNAVAVIS